MFNKKYTKEQLIDALVHEWDYLCHDDYDPEDLTAISTSYEVMDLNDMKNRTKPTVGASLLSLKNTQPTCVNSSRRA